MMSSSTSCSFFSKKLKSSPELLSWHHQSIVCSEKNVSKEKLFTLFFFPFFSFTKMGFWQGYRHMQCSPWTHYFHHCQTGSDGKSVFIQGWYVHYFSAHSHIHDFTLHVETLHSWPLLLLFSFLPPSGNLWHGRDSITTTALTLML